MVDGTHFLVYITVLQHKVFVLKALISKSAGNMLQINILNLCSE
jgi:hypothetical protein